MEQEKQNIIWETRECSDDECRLEHRIAYIESTGEVLAEVYGPSSIGVWTVEIGDQEIDYKDSVAALEGAEKEIGIALENRHKLATGMIVGPFDIQQIVDRVIGKAGEMVKGKESQ